MCKEIDILNSIEFDLTEAIKDLVFQIKQNKLDIQEIKNKLNLLKSSNDINKNYCFNDFKSSWID